MDYKESTGETGFCFKLQKGFLGWSFVLQDTKGKPITPDPRKYTGAIRESLREFYAIQREQESSLQWDHVKEDSDHSIVYSPSNRLINMSLKGGVLCDDQGVILLPSHEYARCVLTIQPLEQGNMRVSPSLYTESGEEEGEHTYSLSPYHVVKGNRVYEVEDLGPYWVEWNFLSDVLSSANLTPFLSLTLSRFLNLDINYEGYTCKKGQHRITSLGLYFKEIDSYEYLHVKPLAYLEGYPPGFFEDQEIVKVVTIDDENGSIRIDEIVFPEPADDVFRSIILKMGKEAKTAVYEESGTFIMEPDFAERFLTSHMEDLLSRFILLQSSLLTKYRLKHVKPRMKLSLKSGINFFEGDAHIDIEGERFSFGKFMGEYKKKGYVVLNDGNRAYPDTKEIRRFERLISKLPGDDEAVSVSLFDLPALMRENDLVIEGEGWKSAEAFFSGYNTISTQKGTYGINKGTLRPYQVYGVKWMEYLHNHGFGACLADEMGLGKTIQVISLLQRAYSNGMQGPSLVIMPRSLIYNWESELHRFAPSLKCKVYYGSDRNTDYIETNESCVILSSYATIRNDIKDFKSTNFTYIVLDESQNIKNLETRTAQAVLLLKAQYKLALSGTPIENNLGDLFSLFRFLNPQFFGVQSDFMKKYLRPIQEKDDQEALGDLRARVYPFMLRRLKKDVLSDLPPKTEQTAYIELDQQHMNLYHRRRIELKERVSQAVKAEGVGKNSFLILQALTELRRLAGIPEVDGEYLGISAKRQYIQEMISDIVAEGHKSLIFTNYLASVELLSEDLTAAGIPNLVMTGATSNRQDLVRQFQTDEHIQVFIMTLKTGGLGLNLTAADYVFIFDPWWNRAAEAQAVDRTHRIGQKNPVFCYRMIAKGTIEEKILQLQETKTSLVTSLLSADSGAIKSLTEDDIAHLLG